MTFGDIDGLQRAAATLDALGQRADQERRAVAAVTASLTSRENWGGTAARAFEASTHNIHGHLRGSAGAATRTAAVLRQLAAELLAAEELDERARQAALAVDAAMTTPRAAPTYTPSFAPIDQAGLRAHADANALAAREAAEAAWRRAAFALQQIWAWELAGAQALDFGSKVGGIAAAGEAGASVRKELAESWKDVEKRRRAGVLASDQTGEALGAMRDARDAAKDNWLENSKLYGKAPNWAKEGFYARAGHAANYSVGDLGQALGKGLGMTRAAGEAGGLTRAVSDVPILGIIGAAASTTADIESGVNPTRAVAANAASLIAATAAVALVSGPAMPFVATVGLIAIAGWGVGNAVHGWLAYGDIAHDFKSDVQTVGHAASWVGHKAGDAAHAVGRFMRSPLW